MLSSHARNSGAGRKPNSCRAAGIVVARGLVVEHHVVGARHAHEVIAAGRGQQQQQVVGRVLVGGGVVGVADVAAHRQAEQLAHEVIFQAGADDLPFVVEIFRPDEADDAVDQERVERARHAVGARLQRQLIDAVMRLGGKRAALAGLEIHHVVRRPRRRRGGGGAPAPARGPRAASQADAEAAIGGLGAGNRLEQQIDRRAALKAASCVVMCARQHACVGHLVGLD